MKQENKLNDLGKLLAKDNIGSIYREKGSPYHYLIEETNECRDYVCDYNTLYIQTPSLVDTKCIFTELRNNNILFTYGPNRVPFCQTNDILDVRNIIINDKKFIHCIDLSDGVTQMFANEVGAFFTPSMITFLRKIDKPFVYLMSMQELRNDMSDKPVEFMSPRGYRYLIEASKLRKDKKEGYNEKELLLLKNCEIELSFENKRREICDWAPSRLSAIYLMDDTLASSENIASMFSEKRLKPKVILVNIAGLARIIKVDYRWVEAYFEEPKVEYIENYWHSLPFQDNSTTWEYLHEGGLFVLDEEYEPYKS
ncbi:hypothetical protein [Pedobacter alpinus]|uniref:Uncharacterized protein n=1 Tax=Pedobacter alpinus TaxID=1590643 RepID=A0ABW5TV22_9SPHI